MRETYVTGGKDGIVRIWDLKFKPMTTIDLAAAKGGYPGIHIILILN